MGLEIFEGNEFERGGMRRLEIDRRGAMGFEGRFPTGHTNTPFVSRFESWKAPLRDGRDQVVSIEDRKIEKLTGDLHANSVQTHVFGSGSAITVAKKSGYGITAATLQLGAQNVGWHKSENEKSISRIQVLQLKQWIRPRFAAGPVRLRATEASRISPVAEIFAPRA